MSEENQVEVEETVDVVETEEQVDETSLEETTAQASLKPSSTKTQMLGDLMSKVAGMTKQDLSAFLDKTLAQVGKEADTNPHGSDETQGSIKQTGAGVPSPRVAVTKGMKEDVDELLAGDDLSEEFKERAATIFEAAVNNRVQIEMVRIEEEMEAKLEEQVTEAVDSLNEQIEKYTDYVVEKWMEENEVAIENNFRVQATESFIEGLKGLFAENYVEVPEEKIDLVDEMAEAIEELEAALESVQAENIELTNLVSEAVVEATFEDVSEGMVETQIEKLRSLAEGIEYADAEEYGEKLKIIKEQYFTESKKEEGSTGLINEEVSIGSNDEADEEGVKVSPEMKGYFDAIQSTIRK